MNRAKLWTMDGAMTSSWRGIGLGALIVAALGAAGAGCGPTFDPASKIETTRVLGARVTAGAETPSRASPVPGETAAVTWLVRGPSTPGAQAWAFALCQPQLSGDLTCGSAPYAVYQGSDPQPVVDVRMPDVGVLGGASSVLLYGRICDGAAPSFDPQSGLPGCLGGAVGTTAAVTIQIGGVSANHNPTADRGLTFDGQAWPAPDAGDDPCVAGPVVSAGTKDHVVDLLTAGSDRETYTTEFGDPPVATAEREALQLSPFSTKGKFQNAFTFVDASDPSDAPQAETKWDAPGEHDVAAATAVTFTFVLRDDRGGTDWTTRTACVTP